MLVNIAEVAECGDDGFCGLALACKQGKCGPCVRDEECLSGEVCVLDHCMQDESVDCESSSQCPDGHACVLSGYSTDVRGNSDMKAFCQGPP